MTMNATEQSITEQVEGLKRELTDKEPRHILARALHLFPKCLLAFSGSEDVALVDMACKILRDEANEGHKPALTVCTLDTGRLHPETYQYLETVRKHYPIELELLSPDAKELEDLVRRKGLFSFYEDGHEECCGIRKLAPLRRRLATVDAWISGQRRDQSPTRSDLPIVELDQRFSTPKHPLVKFNPLAESSLSEVWDYLRAFDVPSNPLHEQGYVSIGCQPCTRPINPSQHEREGRWWWEEGHAKECGLHR